MFTLDATTSWLAAATLSFHRKPSSEPPFSPITCAPSMLDIPALDRTGKLCDRSGGCEVRHANFEGGIAFNRCARCGVAERAVVENANSALADDDRAAGERGRVVAGKFERAITDLV